MGVEPFLEHSRLRLATCLLGYLRFSARTSLLSVPSGTLGLLIGGVLRWLASLDLNLYNVGGLLPTFESASGASFIDVTCTMDAARFTGWDRKMTDGAVTT